MRFHLAEQAYPAHPSFLALDKALKGMTLTTLEVLNEDRILKMTFQKGKKELYLISEFFKKPNCLLYEGNELLFSLNPPSETAPRSQKEEKTISSQELEKIYLHEAFLKERQALILQIKNKLKKAHKQLLDLETTRQHAERWAEDEKRAHLIQAFLHTFKSHSITALDWETNTTITLTINPKLTPQKEIQRLFKLIKKKKASLSHIDKRREEISASIQRLEKELTEIETSSELPHHPPTKTPQRFPYHIRISSTGLTIWVGKSAKDNDLITFKMANGSDLWLHAHHEKGSHVIIKLKKGEEADPQTLEEALQLALYYSQARSKKEGEVIVALKKYVHKPPKGKMGQATVSKHKIYFVKLKEHI